MTLPTPNKALYLSAKPFPHLVLDGVFPDFIVRKVLDLWPKMEVSKDYPGQKLKAHTNDEYQIGVYISNFIKNYFQSQELINFLEAITGIKGLVLDCHDPSLHETFPGGYLHPHLDYTIHPVTGLQHRVNAILFLNENWKPEYNGNLELYECLKGYGGRLITKTVSIEPIFNRLAIFNIDETAYHGMEEILKCPVGMSRKSIAVNYFSMPEKNAVKVHTKFYKDNFVKRVIQKLKK
jgi:Rps23 Pro-64 3,4-dihydroxylase Tpa1-like proline 4-hydroxylase